MELRVREMKPEDVVAVVRIANQSFLETARVTSQMGQRFVQCMRGGRDALFIAETEDGQAVGFVMGRCVEDSVSIGWIAVHPEHQGQGVGRALLEAVEDVARKKGIRMINTGTPFAVRFYEKHGYRCVEVRRAMMLELVGRSIQAPNGISMRLITLDMLKTICDVLDEDEWLNFLETYFKALSTDPEKCILVEGRDGHPVGIGIALSDELYPELAVVSYLFAEKGMASQILETVAYQVSSLGKRWLGIHLPLAGISEKELRERGWEDARLPSFWTSYRLRKEL